MSRPKKPKKRKKDRSRRKRPLQSEVVGILIHDAGYRAALDEDYLARVFRPWMSNH